MKKRVALFLLLLVLLAMTACGSSVKTGDVVQLGGHDWRVLEVQDGKALVLSEKILTTRAYHPEGGEISWAESDIRAYLNGAFLNETFSDAEKDRILETNIENKSNSKYGTGAGDDTVDQVFLLSAKEVEGWLPEASDRIAQHEETGETLLWWLRTPGKGKDYAADITTTGVVDYHGLLVVQAGNNEGVAGTTGDYASNVEGGVRPAMWIIFD